MSERRGGLERCLGRRRRYDHRAVVEKLEFAVVRHPRRGILNDDRWQVAFVKSRRLVSWPRSFLVARVCDVFGGDAAEAR